MMLGNGSSYAGSNLCLSVVLHECHFIISIHHEPCSENSILGWSDDYLHFATP